jgi:hypothetical protein
MFKTVDDFKSPVPIREMPPAVTAEEQCRLAISRVCKALTSFLPGMAFDPAWLREMLATPLSKPGEEAERLFAQGWLAWLAGDLTEAGRFLHEAVECCQQGNTADWLPALAHYWRSRVRLLRGQSEAVPDFEVALRGLKGSPQATAWFVDLLWRAGRVDRAEQVWRSVRGNKRVTGCDEGPVLEARSLLRRGELPPAEKVLVDAKPGSGVVQVECLLLQAWIAVAYRQPEQAGPLLEEAALGPYPAAALARWKALLVWRAWETAEVDNSELLSGLLCDLARGLAAWAEGRTEEAVMALEKAQTQPVVEPFARYALACLGHYDPAAVLASQPGLFLALRCRAGQVLERYRQRQASAMELMDVLQQAAGAGYHNDAADHFRRLAEILQQRDFAGFDQDALWRAEPDLARRRNLFRAVVEVAARRLPASSQRELFVELGQLEWLAGEAEMRSLLAAPLLRLVLQERMAAGPEIDLLRRLEPEEPLLRLVNPTEAAQASALPQTDIPGWQALLLARAGQAYPPTNPTEWRHQLRSLESQRSWRGLARALLLHDAGRRGDLAAAAGLLDDADAWHGFEEGPPRFVRRTVAALTSQHPNHPVWKRSLARWLSLWDLAALGPEGKTLAVQAGLLTTAGHQSPAPAGMPAVPWYLHLAARALSRDDPAEALACVRRALEIDSQLADVAEAALVREALPILERAALAQGLACALRPADGLHPLPAALAANLVTLLEALPDDAGILDAVKRGDSLAARRGLNALRDRTNLPGRLWHHLALVELRAARNLEDQDQLLEAEACWRRFWEAWLPFLASEAAPGAELTGRVLDWLLAQHRRRINDLLVRNDVDRARRLWNLVQELPAQAAHFNEALGKDLAQRWTHFRDQLATEYLVATREAMRYGDIPEGMHADYEKGLTWLRRLLSLDRDNVRLLGALVEICGEYFLDLYHAGTPARLVEQVERHTPFALQLARLIENHPDDLMPRAALAEFFKFRGFISQDVEQKKALYREALRYNPANANIRDLLDTLEAPAADEEDQES